MADEYIPHTCKNIDVMPFLDGCGNLRPIIKSYVDQGVVRLIAGPTKCHVIIDVARPYFRPSTLLESL